MYIYKTNLSKNSGVPSQFDFLKVSNQRGLLRTSNDKTLYRNLMVGAQGEQYMVDMLKKYGQKHWIVLRNIWMDVQGIYESDLILLTSYMPYVFEVKNYDGLFEYEDYHCRLNGIRLKDNCVYQAQKSLINLKNICKRFDRSISAKGALLMVGEHNDVQIHSKIEEVECKTRYQIRNYIQEIAQFEKGYYQKSLDVHQLLNHFEKYETLNPFGPHESYSPIEVLEGRLGIYCRRCGTYDVESSRKFIKCKNNHEELRLDAVIRTIHEFGILTFEHDFFMRSHLSQFMDNQVSDSYLVRTLNRYFTKVQNGKYAKYENKKVL